MSTAPVNSLPLVLVVDDYEDARDMYCEYLEFSGFRTAQAQNGVEALKQATSLLPDIILMDLSLPEMDGWEATRRLKKAAKTKEIPVVALTGHALTGHAESAKEAGCDAFVAKPCLPEDLVVTVKKLLGARSSARPQTAARTTAKKRVAPKAQKASSARKKKTPSARPRARS